GRELGLADGTDLARLTNGDPDRPGPARIRKVEDRRRRSCARSRRVAGSLRRGPDAPESDSVAAEDQCGTDYQRNEARGEPEPDGHRVDDATTGVDRAAVAREQERPRQRDADEEPAGLRRPARAQPLAGPA